MVIIGMLSFPSEASKETGKRFQGLGPLPEYITMMGPYISSTKEEGIQTIVLYELEKSRLPEAFEIISNRYVNYHGVPGLTYSVQVWLDVVEAFKMIGLE